MGQLSYDKGMLILAASQPDKMALATLQKNIGRSLLSHALLSSHVKGSERSLTGWLKGAEKRVPELYRELFPSANEDEAQLPLLLDFSARKNAARRAR